MNTQFLTRAVNTTQLIGAVLLAGWMGLATAGDITPKMQIKIDAYKKQAATWAANPAVIKAVKDGNAQGAIPIGNHFSLHPGGYLGCYHCVIVGFPPDFTASLALGISL